jgi:hypothetical protein
VLKDQGAILGHIGTVTDITERKSAENLQSALYRIAEKTSSTERSSGIQVIDTGLGMKTLCFARGCPIILPRLFKKPVSMKLFLEKISRYLHRFASSGVQLPIRKS